MTIAMIPSSAERANVSQLIYAKSVKLDLAIANGELFRAPAFAYGCAIEGVERRNQLNI